MLRRRMIFCAACLLAGGTTRRADAAEFGYGGAHGPEHWGALNAEWRMCSAGRNQSPVDLVRLIEADLPPLSFRYAASASEIVNNGHTIQVNFPTGSTLEVDGRSFTLLQFHFHSPSEHRIDGRTLALEAHLVHQDAAGDLAVVGVLFNEGAENDLLRLLWTAMPAASGQRGALASGIGAAGLLPADRDYIRYNGSLTTPPCSEGVRWLVMKNHLTASAQQIAAFRQVLGFANNRPAQPVNARPMLR